MTRALFGMYVNYFFYTTGVFRVVGSSGVAFSSLVSKTSCHLQLDSNRINPQAIAVYTFIGVLMMKENLSMKITLIVVVAFWVFDALLVILGFMLNRGQGEESYMSPAPVSTICCVAPMIHPTNLSASTGVRQKGTP